MNKRRVYIARRIPNNPPVHLVLNINLEMTVSQVHNMYVEKIFEHKNYIYNGPWILRPPLSENQFFINKLPSSLKPNHIWNMVKEKIENSDVVIGIVNNKSYGTIAEVGYACKCKNLAVYILPDKGVSEEDLQDLWFLFQISTNTERFWSNDDIINIDEFAELGIKTIEEYKSFLHKVIPNFMKK